MALTASPRAALGRKIEGESDHRKLSLVIDGQRCAARLHAGEGAEGNLLAGRRVHVDIFQRVGILLKLRIDFHDHVILIQLGEDGGDLALAESVVKSVVDVCGEDAQARSGVAVNGERGEQALILLVAGDIANFRDSL